MRSILLASLAAALQGPRDGQDERGDAVAMFEQAKQDDRYFWVALAPEGTRKKIPGWRSGFYRTTCAAQAHDHQPLILQRQTSMAKGCYTAHSIQDVSAPPAIGALDHLIDAPQHLGLQTQAVHQGQASGFERDGEDEAFKI